MNRGRSETRIAEVYDNLKDISPEWIGLKSFVKVRRKVKRKDKFGKFKIAKETMYFISSLSPTAVSAKEFNQGIRNHWLIENSLHYVKDVTLREDSSRIRTRNAPCNMSLVRNIVINIFKEHCFDNIAQAIRLTADNIFTMWDMILA